MEQAGAILGDVRSCAAALCWTRVEEADRVHGADCARNWISTCSLLHLALNGKADSHSLALPLHQYGRQ